MVYHRLSYHIVKMKVGCHDNKVVQGGIKYGDRQSDTDRQG